jgi:riboflavin synthase
VNTVFTGLVEELGAVRAVEPGDSGARIVISAGAVLEGTTIGDSIAVNGCCLTVVDLGPGWWAADAVPETLGRTNLATLQRGDPVNLERPLAVGSRLGGHIVQGHVDCVGRVIEPAPDLRVEAGPEVLPYLVPKGSVTVDGISLTVISVLEGGFTVAVIPHTMAVTTLGRRAPGDRVNIEADVIAKYTERLLRCGTESPYVAPFAGRA